jgi:outer membrane receptor for ferrienterochelin and colicins
MIAGAHGQTIVERSIEDSANTGGSSTEQPGHKRLRKRRRVHACAISGIVKDQQGFPVPGVKIVLEPTKNVETTDDSGQFCFVSRDGGERLVAKMPGFADEQYRINPSDPDPIEVNLIIAPTFHNEVVVSATRTQQRLDDVPVRIDLVKQEIIEITGANVLADALEFTTGVRIESNCQNCNFTQARVLGLEGAYSQILVDGQPLISSVAQVYGIEQIPTRMLDRIEVIKGGGSAFFGAGSVAGAINIIPRRPHRTGGLVENRQEWMDGQPNHSHHAFVDYVSKGKTTYLTLFGQVDRMKPIDFDGDGYTEIGKRSFEAVGARINRYFLRNAAEFTLDFSQIHEYRRGGNRLEFPEHEADIAESIASLRTTVSASWNHTLSSALGYRLSWSLANTNRDTYYGAGRDPNAYGETDNPLIIFDAQMNHYFQNHMVSWGVQHSSDYLNDSQPGYDRHTDAVYRNTGIYAQDSWSFSDDWEALYGLRMDKHSEVAPTILSPRVALKWSPISSFNIRGTFARGFRAPQVFDEDLHITQVGGEGAVIRNAGNLKHESASSYMLGAEWTPSFGIHNSLFEVNAFYTDISDLFKVVDDDDPSTEDREFTRTNFGEAKIYGVEVNLGYALGSRFKVEGGFVFQRGRYAQPDPDFGSCEFFKTPKGYGNLTVVWKQPGLGEFFFGLRYTGSMRLPHYAGYIEADRLEKTNPYTVIDANFNREIPFMENIHLIFSMGVKNLTNAYQDDLDQGPDRDAGYVYGPRFPRTFSSSLKAEF